MRHSSFIFTSALLFLILAVQLHGQQTMLDAHNSVRRQHDLPPLIWSAQLASYAQQWANYLAVRGFLFHRAHNSFGENLFLIEGRKAAPGEVVDRWVEEAGAYDERLNFCKATCGHFTQVVWSDTRRVGCAAADSGDRHVWVCEYDPPGNIAGQRPYTPRPGTMLTKDLGK